MPRRRPSTERPASQLEAGQGTYEAPWSTSLDYDRLIKVNLQFIWHRPTDYPGPLTLISLGAATAVWEYPSASLWTT